MRFGWRSRRNYEPEDVVRRLVSEAKAIHPQKGRLTRLSRRGPALPGGQHDRITELQVLAEKVKSVGLGKVFLIVTGQEAPGRRRQPIPSARGGYRNPRGSFPREVPTQREQHRLRRHGTASPEVELAERNHTAPQVDRRSSASIEHRRVHPHRAVNPNNRFTNTDPAALERYYPLLPYHVILIQEILSRLRNTGPRVASSARRSEPS